MSVGPMGFYSSIAATPLAQTQGSDVDRTATEVSGQARQKSNAAKAESAEGIGQPDGEEHASSDRDADGRRLWEKPLGGEAPQESDAEATDASEQAPTPHASKDASGESGNQLDLTG